jgi:hypothetical protein
MNDLKGAVKGKDAEVALSADGFVCWSRPGPDPDF